MSEVSAAARQTGPAIGIVLIFAALALLGVSFTLFVASFAASYLVTAGMLERSVRGTAIPRAELPERLPWGRYSGFEALVVLAEDRADLLEEPAGTRRYYATLFRSTAFFLVLFPTILAGSCLTYLASRVTAPLTYVAEALTAGVAATFLAMALAAFVQGLFRSRA